MYQDFKDLLSCFHAHGVKYLIVGGCAVSLEIRETTESRKVVPPEA
jgi:hypothetical protein